MSKVRLGYVGCGFMAQKVHLPNFASIPDCELAALAEVRGDVREKVADRFGIEKRYGSHLELADDPEIDAVAVSADYSLQNQIAEDLLRRGKTVFMEKPMATTLARAEAILDAEKAGGSRLMVGYMKRYDAGNQLAKATIRRFRDSGELGEDHADSQPRLLRRLDRRPGHADGRQPGADAADPDDCPGLAAGGAHMDHIWATCSSGPTTSI